MKEYEVITHYRVGHDTVDIYDLNEMLDFLEDMYENENVVRVTVHKVLPHTTPQYTLTFRLSRKYQPYHNLFCSVLLFRILSLSLLYLHCCDDDEKRGWINAFRDEDEIIGLTINKV
jgi:hypothetical protein